MRSGMALCVVWTLASMSVSLVHAAPTQPTGPMTITGTVETVEWVPKHFMKAQAPGFSGTLGVDRVIAARFKVVLKDYSGLNEENVRDLRRFYHGGFPGNPPDHPSPRIFLQLVSDNPELLAVGMRIRVSGYMIAGDEGAIWERHDKLEILESGGER